MELSLQSARHTSSSPQVKWSVHRRSAASLRYYPLHLHLESFPRQLLELGCASGRHDVRWMETMEPNVQAALAPARARHHPAPSQLHYCKISDFKSHMRHLSIIDWICTHRTPRGNWQLHSRNRVDVRCDDRTMCLSSPSPSVATLGRKPGLKLSSLGALFGDVERPVYHYILP